LTQSRARSTRKDKTLLSSKKIQERFGLLRAARSFSESSAESSRGLGTLSVLDAFIIMFTNSGLS